VVPNPLCLRSNIGIPTAPPITSYLPGLYFAIVDVPAVGTDNLVVAVDIKIDGSNKSFAAIMAVHVGTNQPFGFEVLIDLISHTV
jgi:hypothetical protein